MAIAACGKNLRMIDNEPVRKPELDRALALGKVCCRMFVLRMCVGSNTISFLCVAMWFCRK